MVLRRMLWVWVAFVIAVAIFAGCGPKPQCPVAPESVKQAQKETAKVEVELNKAIAERSALEKELSEKQARLEELKNKPELLRKKLEALKKGSGR